MKRLAWYACLVAALATATPGQAQPLDGGLLGRASGSYATLPAPATCTTAGQLGVFLGSPLAMGCSTLSYATATETLTAPTVSARNVVVPALATPAITPPLVVGGTAGAVLRGYKAVAYLADGTSTAASAEVTTATGPTTLSATDTVSGTIAVVPGAVAYRVYRTTGNAATGEVPPRLISTQTGLNFTDTGAAGTAETPSTVNGTGVVTAGRVLVAPGTVAAPGFAAVGYEGYGMSFSANTLTFSQSGAAIAKFGGGSILDLPANGAAIRGRSSLDAVITFPAAATIRLGGADAANHTAFSQTLKVQNNITETNIAGPASFTFLGPTGTGTGAAGRNRWQTGYPGASGTTAHVGSDRVVQMGSWSVLTGGSASPFALISYPASTAVGADLFVTIKANDASNTQAMTYRVRVNSVRDAAGNTQSTVGIVDDSVTLPAAAGSGTLTATFSVTEGATGVTVNATATSSLTETFLGANFQSETNGAGVTVTQL